MVASGSHSSGIPADADLDMQASDFECILKWSAGFGRAASMSDCDWPPVGEMQPP
jgi:hypothetical protein